MQDHRIMKKITIIIPALNEKETIKETIVTVPLDELETMGYKVQLLVVDGASTDGTAEIAGRVGADVVTEPRLGYGRAYKTGFMHSEGTIIATADADSTYPLGDIAKFVRILEEDKLAFLTTNRFALMERGAMSLRNKFGNTILALEIRLLFGLNIRDPESGMWVFRKDILPKLKLGSNGCAFSHEIKLEACYFNKCPWKEVPIRYKPRYQGKVKLTAGWRGWKMGLIDFLHIIKKRIAR